MFSRRIFTALTALAVLSGAPSAAAAAAPAEAAQGRQTYLGVIDGAAYRIEIPESWNGTLIVFSHGYYPTPDFRPQGVQLATWPQTEAWMLEHGYALAASDYRDGGLGFQVREAQEDQLKLLDWFYANIGRPQRTVLNGMSMGAGISLKLDEQHPDQFDGVLTTCAAHDLNATFNAALDLQFVIKTLLAPGEDIELVRPSDPAAGLQALTNAITRAQATPLGRARLALAGAIGGVPGWADAFEPEPTELAERLRQQLVWLMGAHVGGYGPTGRADVEARAGGNPSWNVGIDYRRQFERSAQRKLALRAYAEAPGSDVDADLALVNAAPRIAPDPAAVFYHYRHIVPRATTPDPVLTLHTTVDGGALTAQEDWYASAVRRFGEPRKLRQIYVDRGGHCAFNAAEEITALRALLDKVQTGQWPDTRARKLNAAAGTFGEAYYDVLDYIDFETRRMPPAFAEFSAPKHPRPSI